MDDLKIGTVAAMAAMDGRVLGAMGNCGRYILAAAAAALLLVFAAGCSTAPDGSASEPWPLVLGGAGTSRSVVDSLPRTRSAPHGRRLRRWDRRSRQQRPPLDGGSGGAGGAGDADGVGGTGPTPAGEVCERQQRAKTDLVQLLPSTPGSDLSRDDGRCSRRYASINQAWGACMAVPECAGVVRDNGIACSGGPRLPFELRGGAAAPSRKTNAWVCPARLEAAAAAEAAARPPAPGAPALKEGFLFILHGGCARPGYNCTHVMELREAVASLRALPLAGRPICVLSDGAIPAAHLISRLGVTYVSSPAGSVSSRAGGAAAAGLPLQPAGGAAPSGAGSLSGAGSISGAAPLSGAGSISGAAPIWGAGSIPVAAEEPTALDDDLRVKKLRAYPASPFERTVFLDGDTFVRSAEVLSLFSLLGAFDLAAAFECCRIQWADPRTPYDKTGLMKGNARTAAFFAETRRLYLSKSGGRYWSARSSGEQGAATLALATTDVRFFPLPPAFNARPYTMFQWARVFGVAVYHGKELWRRRADDGAPGAGRPAQPDDMVAYRLARDWEQAARGIQKHRGAPYR